MAQFTKGHKGFKPKGAKSSKTLVLDTFAKHVVEGGMDKFQEELMKLSGKDFVYAYATFFEYVKPKLARTELVGKDGHKLTVEVIHVGNKGQ